MATTNHLPSSAHRIDGSSPTGGRIKNKCKFSAGSLTLSLSFFLSGPSGSVGGGAGEEVGGEEEEEEWALKGEE